MRSDISLLISYHSSLSIPSENIIKPLAFKPLAVNLGDNFLLFDLQLIVIWYAAKSWNTFS